MQLFRPQNESRVHHGFTSLFPGYYSYLPAQKGPIVLYCGSRPPCSQSYLFPISGPPLSGFMDVRLYGPTAVKLGIKGFFFFKIRM